MSGPESQNGFHQTLVVQRQMRHKRGEVLLRVEQPARSLVRATDPELLAQALTNLLTNAFEAAADAPAPEVVIELVESDAGFQIEISDNGPGVPVAQAEAIFLPLVTSKPEGSGIGLPLARAALRSLGGDVVLAARRSPTVFRVSG